MKAARIVAQAGLLALCLVPAARQLTEDRGWAVALASGLNGWAVAGAAALICLASLCLPAAMAAYAQGGTRPVSYRDSAAAYFASQPMKYLPGGFWLLPGRVVLLGRLGYDAALASGGLLFEMAVQALAGALVALALLAQVTGAPAGTAASLSVVLGGAALACGLLLACPAALARWRRGPAAVRGAAERLARVPVRRRLANFAVTLLALSAMWVLTGLSFYLLLVADAPRFDAGLLWAAVGVSTLSSLAGFLTPFSPGGIGVREAAVVLLLSAVQTGPQAALVAVLSRVLALLVELVFAAAAWLVLRATPQRKPTGSPISDSTPPTDDRTHRNLRAIGSNLLADSAGRRRLT